jgi:hypothetical protein
MAREGNLIWQVTPAPPFWYLPAPRSPAGKMGGCPPAPRRGEGQGGSAPIRESRSLFIHASNDNYYFLRQWFISEIITARLSAVSNRAALK